MEWGTYLRALEHVAWCRENGDQRELSFTGLGESTLHPDFPAMLREARRRFPSLKILFSTNGLPSFDDAVKQAVVETGTLVYVSLHRPEVAAKTVNWARSVGLLAATNVSAATESFDWAGQLEWEVTAQPIVCDFLRLGWAVVLVDGRISTCCLDAHGRSIIGHVNDELGSLQTWKQPLCDGCHMVMPEGIDIAEPRYK